MASYIGRHAEVYDIFYADKPYGREAEFVHNCLQKYGAGEVRSLIELACGTGSHALVLEKLGYRITALDYSADMLARARQKVAANSAIDFRLGDMTAFELENKPFDAAVCLFDSIGYVQTNAAIKRVFVSVRDHLRSGGLFIFEFWHAAAMLRSYEPLRVRRWSVPAGELLRISQTTLECAEQLSRVAYSIYELNQDGTYSSLHETQVNRYFLVQEMADLLTDCGLTPVKWFSGFNDTEPVNENTWHIVAVARKE